MLFFEIAKFYSKKIIPIENIYGDGANKKHPHATLYIGGVTGVGVKVHLFKVQYRTGNKSVFADSREMFFGVPSVVAGFLLAGDSIVYGFECRNLRLVFFYPATERPGEVAVKSLVAFELVAEDGVV